MTDEQAHDALHFSRTTCVGAVFESCCVYTNAAAYFSGYVAHKLNKYHLQHLKKTLANCSECSKILDSEDYFLHLFTSFKQYKEVIDPEAGLKYCHKSFVNIIVQYEKVFLFNFHTDPQRRKFARFTRDFIHMHCRHPEFCCELIKDFLVEFFVRCRTNQCIKMWNRSLKSRSNKDKIKALTHE